MRSGGQPTFCNLIQVLKISPMSFSHIRFAGGFEQKDFNIGTLTIEIKFKPETNRFR